MCHCLHCLLRNFFFFFFFFFENAKIWVGRTTLNREKKGDGLSGKKNCLFGQLVLDSRKDYGNFVCNDISNLPWWSRILTMIIHLKIVSVLIHTLSLGTTGFQGTVDTSIRKFDTKFAHDHLEHVD